MRRWRWLWLLALLGACDETVGFLSIELALPSRTPPITCAKDPRRVVTLTLAASCEGGLAQSTYAVTQGASTSVSLSEIPLGSCTIEVQAKNLANRVVLSGKEAVSVERGENPPLKLSLLEERCEDVGCDSDADGLADVDEARLGTIPGRADTDGDGLSDGLEVEQCCTDPLLPGGAACKLLIQSVQPLLGVPGESVLVKASTELKAPQVELGGAPLGEPLADGSIVFGRVGKDAVLGEVRLSAEGTSDVYADLFAVLREGAQSVAELDQKAGAKVGLAQTLADSASLGDLQLVLGSAGTAASSSPVLILSDRRNDLHVRLLIPGAAKPVAVAAVEKLAVVLLRDTSERALIQPIELAPAKLRASIPGLVKGFPVGLALEPGGATALVLYRDALQRVRLDDPTAASAAVTLAGLLEVVKPATDPNLAVKTGCTGLSYRQVKTANGSEGWVFVACNAPPLACPPGITCEEAAHVLRLGPIEKCLPLDGKQPPATQPGSNCWARLAGKGFGRAHGAPVIDDAAGQLYQLSALGVLAGTLAAFSPGVGDPSPLIPIFPLRFEGKASSPRMMVLDSAGQLYAADGPRVWRIDVRQPGAVRPARPFIVGREGEQALTLGQSGDRTLLDVGRVKEGSLSSLISVCLQRCQGCLCAP